MMKTNWGVRLMNALLKWTGNNTRKLVLGFMIATTIVSMIMSDVPCTVLFMGFARSSKRRMQSPSSPTSDAAS